MTDTKKEKGAISSKKKKREGGIDLKLIKRKLGKTKERGGDALPKREEREKKSK